jgi:hypothetical protein
MKGFHIRFSREVGWKSRHSIEQETVQLYEGRDTARTESAV